jgi:hypothetical protein
MTTVNPEFSSFMAGLVSVDKSDDFTGLIVEDGSTTVAMVGMQVRQINPNLHRLVGSLESPAFKVLIDKDKCSATGV